MNNHKNLYKILLIIIPFLLIISLITSDSNANIELIETAPEGSGLNIKEITDALTLWPQLFENSTQTIDIGAFYMLEYSARSKGRIVNKIYDKIANASKNGVKVRIILDYLTMAESEGDGYKSCPRKLDKLPNVEVRLMDIRGISYYSDASMHSKYFVIDSTISVVGGHNWSYAAFTDNRELSIAVESRKIALTTLEIFQTDWDISIPLSEYEDYIEEIPSNHEELSEIIQPRPETKWKDDLPLNVETSLNGAEWVYVVESSPSNLDNPNIPNTEEVILKFIESAEKSIEIEVNTFTTKNYLYDGPDYPNIEKALVEAGERGVQIRILIDAWFYNMIKSYFTRLNSYDNIEVRSIDIRSTGTNYQRGTVHSKLLVVDSELVLIGSSTYSQGQIIESRNVGLALKSKHIGNQAHNLFNTDWNSKYSKGK